MHTHSEHIVVTAHVFFLSVFALLVVGGFGAGSQDWSPDPAPEVLERLLKDLPCSIERVDSRSAGDEVPRDGAKPFILTSPLGGCGPKCQEAWRRGPFLKRFGDLQLAVGTQAGITTFSPNTDGQHHHGWPTSLSQQVAKLESDLEENASYAFDASAELLDALRENTPGWEGVGAKAWPKQFVHFSDMNVFALGPSRTGLNFHDHEPAFLWLVHGRKQWFMFPPGTAPPDLMEAAQGRSTYDWILARDAAAESWSSHGLKGMMHCIQEPGEVMFVPRRWQHATMNMGTAVGFGGQVQGHHERTLANVDADIAAWPRSAGFHVERANHEGADSEHELRVARELEPYSLRSCGALIQMLAQEGDTELLMKEIKTCVKQVQKMEGAGTMGKKQAGVAFAQFAGYVVEQPAMQKQTKVLTLCSKLLKHGVSRNANDDFALFYLGAVHYMLGNHKAARGPLEKVLELRPHHEKADYLLGFLKDGQGGEL